MRRELLRTVDEVVDAFGGNANVAEWLGVGVTAICNWRERKSIPPGWHLRIYLQAQEMGYRIDPKLFGLDVWPPLRLPSRSNRAA